MTALPRFDSRHYVINGVKYPSVTAILSAGIPKPAIASWAARSVAEAAVLHPNEWIPIARRDQAAAIDFLKGTPWRERDKGASRGSALHAAIEAHVLGLPPGGDEETQRMLAQAASWLDRWEWQLSEATVTHDTLGYAGTLDGIVIDRPTGRRLILDIKTNKPGRQGHGIYNEAALQLAAYRTATTVHLPDGSSHPMPSVDGAIGLWVRPDQCRCLEVNAGPDAFAAFLAAFEVAKWAWSEQQWIGSDVPAVSGPGGLGYPAPEEGGGVGSDVAGKVDPPTITNGGR